MGHRANLIIASSGTYELYFSHWCANTLTTDLFWGSEHALNFIRIQRKVSHETGWLNDVLAEGGAVIDIDKKELILYGGEDLLYDIPLRRVYLSLLSIIWQGWEIKWAYEGMVDLAKAAGYPLSNVCTKKDTSLRIISENVLAPPQQKNWLNSIGSIQYDKNTLLIYPLGGSTQDYLNCGPQLLDYRDPTLGYTQIDLADWTPYIPSGGFHIDVQNRTVDLWIAKEASSIEELLQHRWSGWKINWNKDNYEKHIEITKGKIIFQKTSIKSLLNQLETILLYDFDDQVEKVLNYIKDEIGNGKDDKINELALSHVKLDLDKSVRQEILKMAIHQFNTAPK